MREFLPFKNAHDVGEIIDVGALYGRCLGDLIEVLGEILHFIGGIIFRSEKGKRDE
jgi:hypothetical protein